MSLNSKIDEFFARWNKKDSPGMAIAVTKDGKLVHKNAYGMADLDHGIDNTPETVFHCASLAKQFTAMSILLLSDEIEQGQGIFKLDDDVRKYIHELKIPGITIRHLLHHTSGIRDMLIQLTLAGWRWGDDAMTGADVMRLVSRMKTLNFTTPGSGFAYSNTNYFLAGEIVRRASGGISLAEFARQHIFVPLGMESTRFVDTYCETVKNRAYGYRRSDRVRGAPFEKRMPNYDLTGPTNLFTTVEDLLRWDANFVVASPLGHNSAIAALQRPVDKSNAYGLGLYVLRDTNGTVYKVHHNGRTIGYRAHLVHDYERGISIALLCNVEFTNVEATKNIVDEVSQIVQGKEPAKPTLDEPKLEDPPGTKPPEALKEYCGTYYSSEIDTAYEVLRDGTALMIKRPRHPDATLTDFPDFPDDTFVARGFTEVLREVEVTFRRDKDRNNNITELRLDWAHRLGSSRLTDFRFVKQQ